LAGVINIITTMPVPVNTIRGSVLSMYQTNNRQRSLFATIAGNNKGLNWSAWGDYRAAADYRNKYDGQVFNSKFNEKNYGGHIGYNGTWGFGHLIFSSFNQKLGIIEGERDNLGRFTRMLPGGVEVPATENDFSSTQPQVPHQGVNHLKLTSENSFRLGTGRLTLNLGWQQNKRKEFGNADDPGLAELFFDLNTFNYNTAYHFADDNGWNVSVGINGMRQTNKNRGEEVLIPEYNLFDVGSFVFLQKTKGPVTYSGGLRFDNRTLNAEAFEEGGDIKFRAFTKNFSNISGSAGLSFAPSDKLLFKVNLARGFRAPNIPELASNGTHEGTNRYEYGNADLKSESSWQGDVGAEINSDHVLLQANVFYNRIRNFIFYSKLSGATGSDSLVEVDGDFIPAFAFSQRNAALYGAEFLVDIHPHPLDWLHWENTFSYVRGRFASPIEGTNNVPLIPAARWISEIRGEFLTKGKTLRNLSVHFELDHTFRQSNAFSAFETETETPSYTLLNASLSTNITHRNKTLLSVYLIGSNLADIAYQSHLSRLKYTAANELTGRRGVFNMGRNFTIRINVPLTFN
jgi:iron complex outermembrane receptor protein